MPRAEMDFFCPYQKYLTVQDHLTHFNFTQMTLIQHLSYRPLVAARRRAIARISKPKLAQIVMGMQLYKDVHSTLRRGRGYWAPPPDVTVTRSTLPTHACVHRSLGVGSLLLARLLNDFR